MTYLEAIKELEVLANGRYWKLYHETSSSVGVEIHGYISRENEHSHALSAKNYFEAIENVKRMLGMVGSDPAPEDDLHVEPIMTPVRELDPASIEETMTKANEEYQRRGE